MISAGILGICGAPSTGKTTLAQALHARLCQLGADCLLLPEPARELARCGVRIDTAMQAEDYDAFLAAYIARDAACPALGVADRTPADHYCYLATNAALPEAFKQRHLTAVLDALARYRALIYLPPELELVDDSFRSTSPRYRLALDAALQEMLRRSGVPVVAIGGAREARLAAALDVARACWPELEPAMPYAAQATAPGAQN